LCATQLTHWRPTGKIVLFCCGVHHSIVFAVADNHSLLTCGYSTQLQANIVILGWTRAIPYVALKTANMQVICRPVVDLSRRFARGVQQKIISACFKSQSQSNAYIHAPTGVVPYAAGWRSSRHGAR
jgi:hypothetical protein